ncbi:MAG: 6-pyruvoyl trahydropterin synthase family protein, partial [Phycisphaeraceae bacterium]
SVDEHAIDRLDHKHLNLDVPEFADLNPSVEHIAQVIWGMLDQPISRLDAPGTNTEGSARLTEVRVWETGKTACIYRGPAERSAASHA